MGSLCTGGESVNNPNRLVDDFVEKRATASLAEPSRALPPRGHRLIDVLWVVEGVP